MELFTDILTYVTEDYEKLFNYTLEHIIISFAAIFSGVLITLPFGILLAKIKWQFIINMVFGVTNIFQTIPTIALLALMIPIAGIGETPAIIALFLYSLLPLLRNTFAGVLSVDQSLIESAKGMGLNNFQVLFKIELPLAFPYIISSIKITAVYVISWTTLAAIIGAGGLGDLILAGIGLNDQVMIVTGTIIAIILALLLDLFIGFLEKKLTKRIAD